MTLIGSVDVLANKLELTWFGKDKQISIEPRLLIENNELSNCEHDPNTENMLIHGDNLLALKALESKYTGRVKCIYIDPPYNTGSAFEYYDDNIEHSLWLSLMKPRLEILWKLLSDNGSLWISIDDDEQAYMKVLCDELFGRQHFVSSMVWQKRTSPDMRAVVSDGHEYILLYVKDKEAFKKIRNKLPLSAEQASNYQNPDDDPRGVWTSADYTAQGFRPNQMYEITTPGGKKYTPPEGKCWKNIEEVFLQQVEDNRIWFGADGCSMPRRKTFLSEHEGVIPWTWWSNKEVGHNQEAKKEIIALFGPSNVFDTPKPERLIERIIHIASNPGDLVLDSFLGSGTTAAVAQKMGRKYIGIEMGDHAYTHCKVRLDKVIAGEQGGISESLNWQGGGGYRFYELAPTLINEDSFGLPVINPEYNASMLAAAIALHEGFTYKPHSETFWKQSEGNENSYLFVTTRYLNSTYVDSIANMMTNDEYLIIACKSFENGLDKAYQNIAIKKIPQMLLNRCEFGRDNYNLNIVHPPVYEDEEECDE